MSLKPIKKETINTNVVFTLNEKVTLTAPDFLFCFRSDTSNEEVYFIAADVSCAPDRYNRFTIEENDTEDALNGVIKLDPLGFWTYEVYEQNSTTNLDPTGLNMVETGRVLVYEDEAALPTDIETITYVVHE